MTVPVLGGPIRVECIGTALACSAAPLDVSFVLTVMNWLLWGVLIACTAAIVFAGGRMAFSKSICDPHTRETKILLGALAGAIASGSTNAILNAVTSSG